MKTVQFNTHMKRILFLLVAGCGFAQVAQAENVSQEEKLSLPTEISEQWLLELEGDTVSAGEFWKVFNKNNFKQELPSKEALTEYLDLYQKFKLKVKEAEERGLDTTSKFKKEIGGYQKQLAKSYLTDKTVTKDLIKEAYERSKYELKASHVLINVQLDALPSDTAAAYKKAKMVKGLADAGADFDSLALKFSEDPSAKSNKGNLGYFSVFRMVYPFESAAFNTKEGKVSEIVRTRFGYHLIKVNEKRAALGTIRASHIMMVTNGKMTSDQKAAKAAKIKEVHQQLEAGGSFDKLARKYSEHYSSAEKGGVLPWFGANEYDADFEKAVFAISENGEYTAPVKTQFGWHIIRRLDKKELESFDKMELELRKKVSRSDRASKSKEAVLARIKKEYGFKEKSNGRNLNWFYENIDSTKVVGSKWKVPEKAKLKKELFVFAGKKYIQRDFAQYLSRSLRLSKGSNIKLINHLYSTWVRKVCFDYEESRLPFDNQDYISLLKEYRDGIILFDLTDQKVWSKAVEDTVGLTSYYEAHKSNWTWGERVKGKLYTCSQEKYAFQVKALLEKGADMVEILEKVNKGTQLNIRVEEIFSDVKKTAALEGIPLNKGVSEIKKVNESYLVLDAEEIFEPEPKELVTVKGLVAADYQDQLMEDWLKELTGKYRLTYNKESVKQLIRHVE